MIVTSLRSHRFYIVFFKTTTTNNLGIDESMITVSFYVPEFKHIQFTFLSVILSTNVTPRPLKNKKVVFEFVTKSFFAFESPFCFLPDKFRIRAFLFCVFPTSFVDFFVVVNIRIVASCLIFLHFFNSAFSEFRVFVISFSVSFPVILEYFLPVDGVGRHPFVSSGVSVSHPLRYSFPVSVFDYSFSSLNGVSV